MSATMNTQTVTKRPLTSSGSNAKAEEHANEDGNSPHSQKPSADDVLWCDLLGQSLSKMHNHAHGLDQRIEEELAMRVELGGVAPEAASGFVNV